MWACDWCIRTHADEREGGWSDADRVSSRCWRAKRLESRKQEGAAWPRSGRVGQPRAVRGWNEAGGRLSTGRDRRGKRRQGSECRRRRWRRWALGSSGKGLAVARRKKVGLVNDAVVKQKALVKSRGKVTRGVVTPTGLCTAQVCTAQVCHHCCLGPSTRVIRTGSVARVLIKGGTLTVGIFAASKATIPSVVTSVVPSDSTALAWPAGAQLVGQCKVLRVVEQVQHRRRPPRWCWRNYLSSIITHSPHPNVLARPKHAASATGRRGRCRHRCIGRRNGRCRTALLLLLLLLLFLLLSFALLLLQQAHAGLVHQRRATQHAVAASRAGQWHPLGECWAG